MHNNNRSDINKHYYWHKPKTKAHEYICRKLFNIINMLSLPKESKILDAGCGGGQISHEFYTKGYPNIWGIDISISGINIAKRNLVLKAKFEQHDVYCKDLPDSYPKVYDLVLSIEVIEHLIQPKIYLDNIYSWLCEGGYLVISTPYHGYLKNLIIASLNRFDSHVNALSEHGHIKFFSKKTLYKLLEQSGLEVVKFYGSGRLPFLWKSMIIVCQKK